MLFFTAMEIIQECSHEPIEMPTEHLHPLLNFHLHITNVIECHLRMPSTNAIYECTPNAKMSG